MKDLTGKKFNRLTVLSKCNYNNKYGRCMWHCKCDCGKELDLCSNSLLKNNTKSCGCLKMEIIKNRFATHKESKTRLYFVWGAIKKRCYKQNNPGYKNYGGRGIKMCDEWKNDYVKFRDWAKNNGYKENLTIDRINNNGNYEPNNCRWVNRHIQNSNTRRTHFITFNGEIHTMKEWSKILNIKYSTLANRLLTYKWSIEKALSTPKNNEN